jgi:hypothetical protein
MNWKSIFLAGVLTGTFVGLLMTVINQIPLGNDSNGYKITVMYRWSSALPVVIGIPLVSAFGVNKIAKMRGCCEPSLKHLIPVAYLTFLIPVLGASFGAPNSNLETLATIVMLGAIGGIFWSTPFAIWSYFKSRKNEPESEPEPESESAAPASVQVGNVGQNITIKDSVVMGDVGNNEDE